MGRIKTTYIKRITNKLIDKYQDEFKTNFDENKKVVDRFADFPSKKMRNVVVGYITRLMKVKALEK